jgi:urease accessory protein
LNLRLLQLASPALPVGAYSYSQGLEAAIEAGVVRDAESAVAWIEAVLQLAVARFEAPVLLRAMAAWHAGDCATALHWNSEFVASRESAELRAETLQMGFSLARLLQDLGEDAAALEAIPELSYPVAYALAAVRWHLAPREALGAYLYAWVENQVLASVKAVPLGQTDGQRMLLFLAECVPLAVQVAGDLRDDELANFTPGLALMSARHETQYTRIFRS